MRPWEAIILLGWLGGLVALSIWAAAYVSSWYNGKKRQ